MVVDFVAAVGKVDTDLVVGCAGNVRDGGIEKEVVWGEASHDSFDIRLPTILYGEPVWPLAY